MTAFPRRILVIRRDNIGDLLCTTPLLSALRSKWPDAWIGVLANRYNAPILEGNPDINAFFAYEKAKHREEGKSRLSVWFTTARLLWRLRRMKLDWVLCASPGARRFARLLTPRRVVEADRSGSGHEVAITWRLLEALKFVGGKGAAAPLEIIFDENLANLGPQGDRPFEGAMNAAAGGHVGAETHGKT